MKPTAFLLALAAISMPAYADGSSDMSVSARTPVSDARPVLLAAIQDSNGEAHGVLTGDAANAISQRFGGSSPIFIDVTTERRYQQPGCSRLKVMFWQDGVLLPGVEAPRRQTMEFGINYCLDGLPPKALL